MSVPEQNIQVQIPESLPTVVTQNLLLRPLADSDAADLFAIRSRPEVAKTNHPKTPHQSIEETREWMATKIFTEGAEHLLGRHFTYVLVERGVSGPDTQHLESNGRAIGYVGINEVSPSPEIGYSIHPDCWGKGYATEALGKLLEMWWDLPRPGEISTGCDEARSNGGEVEKVVALCEQGNLGSSKVLTKCGFQVVKEVVYGEDRLFLWEIEQPRK